MEQHKGVPGPADELLRTGREAVVDPLEDPARLLRDLRASRAGLSEREAARRLVVFGLNELSRRAGRQWPRQLIRQLTHPLALLLWLAALLSYVSGSAALAVAIAVVILLNAAFAFLQERHAENAVEALAAYLPPQARVLRDGQEKSVEARLLVPGDVVVVREGDRVSADARLLEGSVEIDNSTLTGESAPVLRQAAGGRQGGPLLQASDVVFSGSTCVGGDAEALVFATGMRTELGRIAALSERTGHDQSPLEKQVNRVARVIALVAVAMGVAFVPVGVLISHMPPEEAVKFAVGLLVANVPEGLLPTITLALAVGVRLLARQGALVKRISAVETLGAASVICTDKTGTLTMNKMTVTGIWTVDGYQEPAALQQTAAQESPQHRLAAAAVACNNAVIAEDGSASGDPTEIALLNASRPAATTLPSDTNDRLDLFHFDPVLRRMSTVDRDRGTVVVHCKGAPEEVLPLCTHLAGAYGEAKPLTYGGRDDISGVVNHWASRGLRILAFAERPVDPAELPGLTRDAAENGLILLGLMAMEDPPRPGVAEAVARCHTAGIRLIVVTGDNGLTARGIAMSIGIGTAGIRIINGDELDRMSESDLDEVLASADELIFARSSPEAKLRITDALQDLGQVVSMTGDGVNDAPALRRADIGVAMGLSGTDVAREAATMILTNDDFASIVSAVRAGRQVYDNVRKFILYIFAHATPEVVPFLLYAVSGGQIPLPLTVMQILAIDLGTETLPALALGREPEEPGIMDVPPRRRGQNIIDGPMLARAWGLLGGVSAVLVTGAFIGTLMHGGWYYGADTSNGPLHQVWMQATTMAFLGIVACQIGTAMAARCQRTSLAQTGLMSNPLLLAGIGFEIAFTAAVVYLPALQQLFGTAPPAGWQVVALAPFPFIVWGSDELWRYFRRHRRNHAVPATGAGNGR